MRKIFYYKFSVKNFYVNKTIYFHPLGKQSKQLL